MKAIMSIIAPAIGILLGAFIFWLQYKIRARKKG